MSSKALQTYKTNAVVTQSPGKIVVMLYEGAIRFLQQAIDALEKKDYIEKGRLINRATDIILELDAVLNMEAGGEIARNLRRLYRFMVVHLMQANFKKDPERIRQTIHLLKNLLDGWKQIAA